MTQTSDWKDETTEETIRPFALVKMELPSGTVRFFTGVGELSWDSQTWTGAGDLGYIGAIESGTDLRAGRLEVGLSGLDATVKADALNELSRGSDCYVYLGFFTSSATIVADPWLAFFGTLDQTAITEDDDGVSISVSILDGIGARLRRTQRRRTDADQQEIFSGDKIFEFVGDDTPVSWGAPGGATGGGGNNGGAGPGSGGAFRGGGGTHGTINYSV